MSADSAAARSARAHGHQVPDFAVAPRAVSDVRDARRCSTRQATQPSVSTASSDSADDRYSSPPSSAASSSIFLPLKPALASPIADAAGPRAQQKRPVSFNVDAAGLSATSSVSSRSASGSRSISPPSSPERDAEYRTVSPSRMMEDASECTSPSSEEEEVRRPAAKHRPRPAGVPSGRSLAAHPGVIEELIPVDSEDDLALVSDEEQRNRILLGGRKIATPDIVHRKLGFAGRSMSNVAPATPPVIAGPAADVAGNGKGGKLAVGSGHLIVKSERRRRLGLGSSSLGSKVQQKILPAVSSKEKVMLSRAGAKEFDMVTLGVSWRDDLFAMPHNAIRQEIKTLIVLVDALSKRVLDITPGELNMVGSWFRTFRQFISDYFALEEEVIFFWLDVWKVSLPPNLTGTEREKKRNQVTNLIRNVCTAYAQLERSASIKHLDSFVTLSLEIGPALAPYFNKQEVLLPPRLESEAQIGGNEYLAVQKSLYTFISRRADPNTFFVMLTRWVDMPESVRSMEREFLSLSKKSSKVGGLLARKKLFDSKRRLAATHFSVMDRMSAGVPRI